MSVALADPIRILAPGQPAYSDVLSSGALSLLTDLTRSFRPRLDALLARRRAIQEGFDRGELPTFSTETEEIRKSAWTVAPIPADIADRRVEITGPVDRKMIINALNSGANVFMADFEDSTTPTWHNLIEGQRNLVDAVHGRIRHVDAASGKTYALAERTATLFVRPRGWHLPEKHVLIDNRPVPAALFDFAVFFHNAARELCARGKRPYFYLPKLESHLEARLWNDVFVRAQDALSIPCGTIRATVLIETLPAAFEMDEILYELREHSAGLNCGRWDYIFSFIKKLRSHAAFVLPDRAQVTMEQPFLSSYTKLLVKTCHRRGAHAMGGMAAQIPIKGDEAANRAALDKVRADKLREVEGGHDGTWVAHPGLVPLAREIFDAHMPQPNQVARQRDDIEVRAEDLVRVPAGTRSEAGLVHNVRVGVQYLAAWLRGTGCVPLYHLMEDAATAEICRAQIWQWLRHGATLDDASSTNVRLTVERFRTILDREVSALGGDRAELAEAAQLFDELCTSERFEEFLTLPAYDRLVTNEPRSEGPPPRR